MDLADQENEGRDPNAIAELLKQLAELRELDRRRQAHAPGSAAHDAATLEVDLRSRRLMDAFRDLEDGRRDRDIAEIGTGLDRTRPVDARSHVPGVQSARLN
jgi:hypothetical protein